MTSGARHSGTVFIEETHLTTALNMTRICRALGCSENVPAPYVASQGLCRVHYKALKRSLGWAKYGACAVLAVGAFLWFCNTFEEDIKEEEEDTEEEEEDGCDSEESSEDDKPNTPPHRIVQRRKTMNYSPRHLSSSYGTKTGE